MYTAPQRFRERFGAQFKENEPLSRHLNFRVGGPARYFLEVRSGADLEAGVKMANDLAVDWVVLGGGSNTLASDEGYLGLVIKIAFREVKIEGDRLVAEAGAITASVARQASEQGLTGLEWAISLPGTIGGAVRGNAGCFGGEISDHLLAVTVLHNGVIEQWEKEKLEFSYRHSILKNKDYKQTIVVVAEFQLAPADPKRCVAKLSDFLQQRKLTQPFGTSSAGCVFVNVENFTEEQLQRILKVTIVPAKMLQAHRLGAGWLIEQAGFKGTRVGQSEVSLSHGNFLVNLGQARASEISQLIKLIKRGIYEKFGIRLQEELSLIGLNLEI